MPNPFLRIEDLFVHYGNAQAVAGMSLALHEGELLALIGANGAGKTTLMKTICGLVTPTSGQIRFGDHALHQMPAPNIVQSGVAMVPEGRRLFRSLSVEENLVIGGQVGRPGPWSIERIYEIFPILKERREQPSTSLSGGQQQMVAIGRALMSNPTLLLLDEVSLGLAPVVIKDIYKMLPKILGEGTSAILVEQDVNRAMSVADRFICMLEGKASLEGDPREFTKDQISTAYFGA